MDERTGDGSTAPRAASLTWVALLAYTAIFAWYAWPWLRAAADTVPSTWFGHRSDERLVAHILAWGAHALATQPLDLFQLPINYPAPRQLTGSEHLLSTEIVFAPVFWFTGNAVLAANLATFAAYPLGAGAMYWLLIGLGCDRLVAFAAGLALALGPGQVPAHLHGLQYLVLYLPLVAGMLTRLRLDPSGRRTVGLAVVCLLAFFSSYYTCVLTGLVAALWALAEACRPGAGRRRFVVLASVGVLAPALVLGLFSLPYLARPETAHVLSPPSSPVYNKGIADMAQLYSGSSGRLLRVLAVLGLVGLASGASAARTAARRGLGLAIVGGLLMLGPGQTIHGVDVPLPFALLAASPLKFVRYPFRFIGVVTFGRALLVAGGLQAVRHLLPRWLSVLVVLGVTTMIATTRAPIVAGRRYDTIASATEPVYDLVGRVVHERGAAPLLELPILLPNERKLWNEGDALLGQTRHWLPLVAGHTGFHPPHRALVLSAIARLPASTAIQTLVDLTHVRWVLLRPRAQWPPRLAPQREAILRAPWATRALTRDDWVLLRIRSGPRHEAFFAAIARGWQPGTTALGTLVAPVPAAEARATVTGHLPPKLPRNSRVAIDLTVTNGGAATWPVSVPTFAGPLDPPYEGQVHLRATWRRAVAGAAASDPVVFDLELPRDVPGHESLAYTFWLPTPAAAGRYELELAVRQKTGEGFTPPASESLRGRVAVR